MNTRPEQSFFAHTALNIVLILVACVLNACSSPMPVRATYTPVDTQCDTTKHLEAQISCSSESNSSLDEAHTPLSQQAITDRSHSDAFSLLDYQDFVRGEHLPVSFAAYVPDLELSDDSEPEQWMFMDEPMFASQLNLQESPRDTATKTKAQAAVLTGVININTASINELTLLHGIGPSLAERIIEYREQREFTKPEHLRRVRGIGQSKYMRIKEYLAVSGQTTLARQ